MRAFALVLTGVVTAAALAADPSPVERLNPYSVMPARRGGTVLLSFSAPTDAAARDLRAAAVAVRVDDDVPVVFDASTPGLRIHRSGSRARYAAPKHSDARIAKFRLSTVAGAFSVSLRGEPLESRSPPFVELSLSGRRYRFDPEFPDGPPPPVIPLPDGLVTFSTCTRNVVSVASAVTSTVIRSPAELTHFLATVTPLPDDVAALGQNDFSQKMILVAVGDGAAAGVVPFAVNITGVRSIDGTLAVYFDKLHSPSAPAPAPGGPPRSAFYHAVAVPTSGMPVQFTAASVEAQNPWN